MSEVKLPEYQCLKVVGAAKIATISGAVIGLSLHKSIVEIEVDSTWLVKHEPEVGGYFVRYEDGYASYSPASAFESGYVPVYEIGLAAAAGVPFGIAVDLLKDGHRVARKDWNGKGMWLELQKPDEHSKMTLPYIFMRTADENYVPWLASQTDVLCEDWVTVGDKQ